MANPYRHFGKFILRTPYFPVNKEDDDIINSEEFKEALYLATPEFYENSRPADKQDSHIDQSVNKYCWRSKTRCTPFGLFAGCSIGEISNKTEIELADGRKNIKKSRFDVSLVENVRIKSESIDEIRHKLRYFPNDTIYNSLNQIRYIEYRNEGINRAFNISGVDADEFVEAVLNRAKNGETISSLANSICSEDISYDEAAGFVEDMIKEQLLKSELNISLTDDDPFGHILNILTRIAPEHEQTRYLQSIYDQLSEADNSVVGSGLSTYKKIIDSAVQSKLADNGKHVIQTDLFKPANKAQLSNTVVKDIKNVMYFILNLTNPQPQSRPVLEEFKRSFSDRYEQQEIPLLEALDPNIGIGYGGHSIPVGKGLLKGITFSAGAGSGAKDGNLATSYRTRMTDAYTTETKEIVFSQKDIDSSFEPSWTQLPDTMYAFCSLVKNDDNSPVIHLQGIGGSSGVNMFSRFTHLDDSFFDFAVEIAGMETKLNPERIVATINHLPGNRVGNVILRKSIRDYEIIYLQNSQLEDDHIITLGDLWVSVKNNRVVLRSKRHSKEVLPVIDNAHAYQNTLNPVYTFLCDLQTQQMVAGIGIPKFEVGSHNDYIPRIRFENCILAPAQWLIRKKDVSHDNGKKMFSTSEFRDYLKKRGVPDIVILPESDNELKLDTGNPVCLDILLKQIKKYSQAILNEYLYNAADESVRDENNYFFRNELVIPLHKTQLSK